MNQPQAFESRELLSGWNPASRSALLDLAHSSHPITVVAGAGVSRSAGLPSWDELVLRLVRYTLNTSSKSVFRGALSERELAQLPERILAAHGPITAAEWVESKLTRRQRAEALIGALYEGASESPGLLAASLAELALIPGTIVFTTNYDDSIERAHKSISSATRLGHEEDLVSKCVYHLHGLIPHGANSSDLEPDWYDHLVLTDTQFAALQDGSNPLFHAFQNRLETTTCLFVGCSLSDPNLVRSLIRARRSREAAGFKLQRHYATFFRGDIARAARDHAVLERIIGDISASGIVHAIMQRMRDQGRTGALELELFFDERFDLLSVTPVWADFYVEIPQFVHEIGRARSHVGRAGLSLDQYVKDDMFGPRVRRWRNLALRRYGLTDQPLLNGSRQGLDMEIESSFATFQKRIQHALSRELAEVLLQADVSEITGTTNELLALHLWAYSPRPALMRAKENPALLELWASTVVLYRAPWALVRRTLGDDGPVPVEGFCTGNKVNGPVYADDRWQRMLAIPIRLWRPYGLATCGVIVLSSTDRTGALHPDRPEYASIDEWVTPRLLALGERVLRPTRRNSGTRAPRQ
jgi:hypothetical protein